MIRKARKVHDDIGYIRAELIAGEKSGTSNRTPNDIINAVLDKLREDGTL